MHGLEHFSLTLADYLAFGGYFVLLSLVGWWFGRHEKQQADDYFLAGRSLPWYVVGSSFIASNISTEHFVGMIGASMVYGICVAMTEWGNVLSFSVLIWVFIPFLLASRVFTTPEFMERRFHPALRQLFALLTVVSNVVAFLAAVLYGGGLALHKLFGWSLPVAVVALALVAGVWAIYGGLRSVAWTDFLTVVVMIAGGLMVTLLGLKMLAGPEGTLWDGWQVMIERNRAAVSPWREAALRHAQQMVAQDHYNRLSVFQPATHQTNPWPSLVLGLFSVSIWYNVINQFMIQRVLGARDMYHARMGIVLAGYMKVLMPVIVVVPGLILFAQYPQVMNQPWEKLQAEADKGYVHMLQTLIPTGLRGLFLAALFGAIQSTVNSVLNSTATVFTLDIYRRWFAPRASHAHLVRAGMVSAAVILAVSIVLAMYIERLGSGLFVYIQTLYAFFAPPFSAVFVLGILWRRINGPGALTAVVLGFAFGIAIKLYVQLDPQHPEWLEPFAMQGILNWAFCSVVCVVVSLLTRPPRPEQVTDQLTLNWRKLDIFSGLGTRWYNSVVTWWLLFVLIVLGLMLWFSGLVY